MKRNNTVFSSRKIYKQVLYFSAYLFLVARYSKKIEPLIPFTNRIWKCAIHTYLLTTLILYYTLFSTTTVILPEMSRK